MGMGRPDHTTGLGYLRNVWGDLVGRVEKIHAFDIPCSLYQYLFTPLLFLFIPTNLRMFLSKRDL